MHSNKIKKTMLKCSTSVSKDLCNISLTTLQNAEILEMLLNAVCCILDGQTVTIIKEQSFELVESNSLTITETNPPSSALDIRGVWYGGNRIEEVGKGQVGSVRWSYNGNRVVTLTESVGTVGNPALVTLQWSIEASNSELIKKVTGCSTISAEDCAGDCVTAYVEQIDEAFNSGTPQTPTTTASIGGEIVIVEFQDALGFYVYDTTDGWELQYSISTSSGVVNTWTDITGAHTVAEDETFFRVNTDFQAANITLLDPTTVDGQSFVFYHLTGALSVNFLGESIAGAAAPNSMNTTDYKALTLTANAANNTYYITSSNYVSGGGPL